MTKEDIQKIARLSKMQRVLMSRWHEITKKLHAILDVDPEYLEMKRTGVMPKWIDENREIFPGYAAFYRKPGETTIDIEKYVKSLSKTPVKKLIPDPPISTASTNLVDLMLKNVTRPTSPRSTDPFATKPLDKPVQSD